MAQMLQRTLGEDIAVRAIPAEGLWKAVADPSQVEDAILNLAVNARDAMPRGGHLSIETANASLDEAYAVQNFEVTPGDYVVLTVTDTGTGMQQEVIERAFEPFFTTKDVGQGTGLGLSMVYGFIKQSGGHIKIDSEEGHGTTFKLYLPRSSESVAPIERPVVAAEGGEETILVVADAALVRQYVFPQLESLRYAVLAAASASEALDMIAGGRAFDLLFTDVILGSGFNGPALANEILRLRPRVKVLYTSGYTKDAVATNDRLDTGGALIHKPYRKI